MAVRRTRRLHGLALTSAALFSTAALAGCGSSSSTAAGGQAPAATTAATATASGGSPAASGACSYRAESDDTGGKHPGLPPTTPALTSGTQTATLVTNVGTVVFTMNAAKTPCTAESFTYLASKMFFDNTPCHRLTTQGIYVLQCGDPTGSGSGGPGYTIPDENLAGATYPAGSVAMANTGQPHTGGSQFFLNYRGTTALQPQYTPFGTITQGLDVLQKIAAAGTTDGGADGAPKTAVVIKSFRVTTP